MKANELMIGDWVFNTHNRKPEQVQEIRERMMGEQRHFTYYLGPSLSMLSIYDADFSVHIGDGARYVKNVHQFQHILKDCGIDKEIIVKEAKP